MNPRRLFVAVAILAAAGSASAGPSKKDAAKPKEPPPKEAPKEPAPEPIKPPEPTTPTKGDGRRIVGILDVQVNGVPEEVKAQFQSRLEALLDPRHYWLSPKSRMHAMLANSTKWAEGCVIGHCLAEVKTQTGADLVLLAALNGSGTSFGYVVTLVRTDTGRVLAQESERCDVCTVNEALANATLATVKLLNAVPDKLPDEAGDQRAQVDLASTKLKADLSASQHHHKVAGAVMLITGAIVAGAGAAIYVSQDHSKGGAATAAAGGGLLLGGLFTLAF